VSRSAVWVTAQGRVDPGSTWSAETDLAENNWRQLDRTGHLATLAAKRALAAATATGVPLDKTAGLCLGTMFGSLKTICEFDRRALAAGPQYAKPMDFANSVINAAAGQVAIWHGLEGVNATISGGPSAGLQAIAWAAELVRRGRASALLAGGADEVCDDAQLAFGKRGDLTRDQARPFDARRDGFRLAEGAALVLLEGDVRDAEGRAAAEIVGWASAFDPSRGSDDERAARAAERAMREALTDAGLSAEAVGVVAVSANGSLRGDRAEARAVAAVFGLRVPVLVTKGALGETLGAGGGFSLSAAIDALASGRVAGAEGLETYDTELPTLAVTCGEQTVERNVAVVHAAGFDGQHVALVARRVGRAD
jgi:3-oxoacyl-[acyl-carrier-protein] synthase II